MDEPIWIDRLAVDAIHYDQFRQHGGLLGIKGENALESALARARHKYAYEPDVDLCLLAAAYGFGLVTNNPYRCGSKRVAFMTMYAFLGVNGLESVAEEPEVGGLMLDVATRSCDEAKVAKWLRGHVAPFAEWRPAEGWRGKVV